MDLSWRGSGARVAGNGAGSASREAGGSGGGAGFAGCCGEFSGHDGAKKGGSKIQWWPVLSKLNRPSLHHHDDP